MSAIDTPATEANERLARRMTEEIWNQGNLEFIDEVTTVDSIVHFGSQPAPLRGTDELKAFVGMYHEAFPDLEVELEDVIAAGDTVVSRYVLRGTHEGELLGVEPTANEVEFRGIDIIRFEEGKVVEEWNHGDVLGLLQQIEAIPDPVVG